MRLGILIFSLALLGLMSGCLDVTLNSQCRIGAAQSRISNADIVAARARCEDAIHIECAEIAFSHQGERSEISVEQYFDQARVPLKEIVIPIRGADLEPYSEYSCYNADGTLRHESLLSLEEAYLGVLRACARKKGGDS